MTSTPGSSRRRLLAFAGAAAVGSSHLAAFPQNAIQPFAGTVAEPNRAQLSALLDRLFETPSPLLHLARVIAGPAPDFQICSGLAAYGRPHR